MAQDLQPEQQPTKFHPEVLHALARDMQPERHPPKVTDSEQATLHAEDYMAVWLAYNRRRELRWHLDGASNESDEYRKRIQDELDSTPEVSALYALAASAKIIDLLTANRWPVMNEAREDGAIWVELGAALGITKQGARDYYNRTEPVFRAIEETLNGTGEAVELDWRS
jgi:hypothetical protein